MEISELVQYFKEEFFLPNLNSETKDEALLEIVTQFEEQGLIRKKEILLEMLKRREGLGSTGIGKGIAIPHGRSTVAKDVIIAFGKSSKGIDFNSVDGKPVHLIFMVVAPPIEEGNKYLPVLGKLVEFLNNEKTRDNLMKIKSFDALVKCFNEV
jgi:fructose-specific phosphotransferase system IIA component